MNSNLPPGVTRLPGEEPEALCDLCGKSCDECDCPECADCGANGCIKHIPLTELYYRWQGVAHEARRRGYADMNAIVRVIDGDCAMPEEEAAL